MLSKPITKVARGLKRYTVREDGLILDSKGNPPDMTEDGLVELVGSGGGLWQLPRAVIVATEFLYKDPKHTRVIHLDGDPNNTHAENLMWDYSEDHYEEPPPPPRRLRKKERIWEELQKGTSVWDIMAIVGCCHGYIARIRAEYNKTRRKRSGKNVTKKVGRYK